MKHLKHLAVLLFASLTLSSCYCWFGEPPQQGYTIVKKYVVINGVYYYDYYHPYQTNATYYVVVYQNGGYRPYVVNNYNAWYAYTYGSYYYIY